MKELDLSKIHPILKTSTNYAISTGGKRLRPLITILCAEILGVDYKITKNPFLALELIHNATLVHDDIIDEDLYRRGVPSNYVKNGIKKAVLTGDALLSMGLMYAAKTGNPRIVQWLSETSLKMVQGIAIQNQKKRQLMSIDEYLNMNYLKSGSLFEAAAAIGGEVGTKDINIIIKLSEFGKFFGNAYQIKDDIIDAFTLSGNDNTPKNDLLNGDISLLLIHTLESEFLDSKDKDMLLDLYYGKKQDINLNEIRRIYITTGALKKSINKMLEFLQKAQAVLLSFNDCDAKKDLLFLIDQVKYEVLKLLE